ncbi:hypothetical protein HMPREF9946_03074 [Acetobacteraceae bacterium AT-5844]|nr:hypothetical protein HMPREF9946_03074 [Acetobacteraceae bacterium AT-5844]
MTGHPPDAWRRASLQPPPPCGCKSLSILALAGGHVKVRHGSYGRRGRRDMASRSAA